MQQKVDECLAERQKAMDARSGEEGITPKLLKLTSSQQKLVSWSRMTLFGIYALMLS
ncbi:hypothetical protein JCM19053_1646 [Vibrio sp. JCM 19053]|nr:hypothetical protein JCM19053_1646 [Vibrio sp. JCM 19053]